MYDHSQIAQAVALCLNVDVVAAMHCVVNDHCHGDADSMVAAVELVQHLILKKWTMSWAQSSACEYPISPRMPMRCVRQLRAVTVPS